MLTLLFFVAQINYSHNQPSLYGPDSIDRYKIPWYLPVTVTSVTYTSYSTYFLQEDTRISATVTYFFMSIIADAFLLVKSTLIYSIMDEETLSAKNYWDIFFVHVSSKFISIDPWDRNSTEFTMILWRRHLQCIQSEKNLVC